MAETSTPDKKSLSHSSTTREPSPKSSTLAFLRQFARCYVAQPSLAPSLAGMVVN